MTDLTSQPIEYDWRRVRYQPKYIYDCGHCHEPLKDFAAAMLNPGGFQHPGMAALLCERCTDKFWAREERAEKAADGAGY